MVSSLKPHFRCFKETAHKTFIQTKKSTPPDASYKEKPYSITQLPIKYLWRLLRIPALYTLLQFLTTLERIFVLFIGKGVLNKTRER